MDYNSVLWANILQQRNLKKGTISQTCIDPFYTLHEASRLHFTFFEFPRVSSRSSDPQTS
ncbi:hypothetical protein HanPSC8_Chr11g0458881 [Helianthus annuus]|nr:hypothetical protein HanPSC8_Chr11g0458881 [Helianthus annuus]